MWRQHQLGTGITVDVQEVLKGVQSIQNNAFAGVFREHARFSRHGQAALKPVGCKGPSGFKARIACCYIT